MSGRALILAVGPALLLAPLCGCGPTTASVRGRVTYQDKPVALGTLTFVREDGWTSKPIALDDDGRFAAKSVPVGKVTAVLSTPPPLFFAPEVTEASKRTDPMARDEYAKKHISIPAHYANPKTSGLIYDLQPGENVLEIALPEPGDRPTTN
jgi:hypothetical protein